MTKKYVIYRVPIDADKGFKEKKKRIETDLSRWTGKQIKIPMTRILQVVANNPVELGDASLIKLTKKNRIIKVKKVKKEGNFLL